jgi:hypothetical protein
MEQQQVIFGFARSAYAHGAYRQCISFLASSFSYDVKLFTELLFIDNNLEMASTACSLEPDNQNIEMNVLKMALVYVDLSTFLKGAPRHPLLFKWSKAIIAAKFLLLLFIHQNVTNLSCLPRLEKFKMFHFFGILCVNTGNLVLGKAAVEAAVRAVPSGGDFAGNKAKIAADLAKKLLRATRNDSVLFVVNLKGFVPVQSAISLPTVAARVKLLIGPPTNATVPNLPLSMPTYWLDIPCLHRVGYIIALIHESIVGIKLSNKFHLYS